MCFECSYRPFGSVLIITCLQEDFITEAWDAPKASDRRSGKCCGQESDMARFSVFAKDGSSRQDGRRICGWRGCCRTPDKEYWNPSQLRGSGPESTGQSWELGAGSLCRPREQNPDDSDNISYSLLSQSPKWQAPGYTFCRYYPTTHLWHWYN